MPAEADQRANQVALLLATMAFAVPAIGASDEAILQDTLKSILVSFFVISACLLYCWPQRHGVRPLKVHVVLCFSGVLLLHALGSMLWSHTYLGGVEATRWLVFSLIVLMGANVLTLDRTSAIAWGMHLGAFTASLWAALQFWFDFQWFAQGPNPASTFVNRNFFAEFVVGSLPFSVLLLTRLKDKISVFLMAPSLGFNVLAILMTGTRSALLALFIVTPLLLYTALRLRSAWRSSGWHMGHGLCLFALIVSTIVVLGSIPTRNAKLLSESAQTTAIGRAFDRSTSLVKRDEYQKGSFSMRWAMWKATASMIAENPVRGVGAGAWEVHIPTYEVHGHALEPDYYAHNEFLQLVAEYGSAGWLVLLGLFSYLIWSAYQTWGNRNAGPQHETLLRTCALLSLLALFVVSCAGFPWRLAATGSLFALNLALLAASDMRLPHKRVFSTLSLRPLHMQLAFATTCLCALGAVYVSLQAAACESKLTQAIKISIQIRNSGNPHDQKWEPAKALLLKLMREGIAINPHYRKLTPIVADALASWGDWGNAIWIWESVLQSRPQLVGVMANIVRGYVQTRNPLKAQDMIERMRALRPDSITAHSLEVLVWSRHHRELEAAARATDLLGAGLFDRDLVQTAYHLGRKLNQPNLATLALKAGIRAWPERAVDGWLKLGDLYASPDFKDEDQAIASYRMAFELSPPVYKPAVRAAIPLEYQAGLP